MKKNLVLLILLVFGWFSAYSQDPFVSDLIKKAGDQYSDGDFCLALKSYKTLYKTDTNNTEYQYKYAVCLIETNRDIELAIRLLEKNRENENIEPERLFHLARGYHSIYEFTKAVELFVDYREKPNINENLKPEVERNIQMAYNAKEIMSQPLNVSFENLGEKINSSLDEVNPFVPGDESYLVFGTNKSFDPVYGTFVTNVFTSTPNKKGWNQGSSDKQINSYDNELPVFLSKDGKTCIICNNLDGQFSDLIIAEKKGKDFRMVEKYNSILKKTNSTSYEIGGSFNKDFNTFFFSSNRKGGLGGFDIYCIKKLPNGDWSEPENLVEVNSPYDDAFPIIQDNSEELYFASKGHNSIGGYDLFVSYWNRVSQKWTKPINLGYPINSVDDNTTICFPDNKRYAYLSTIRKEGLGGYDIYRLIYNDVELELSLIKGELRFGEQESSTSFKGESSEVSIQIFDVFGNLFGIYLPKPGTGNFVAVLPPGNYTINIEYDGFEKYEETFSIGDRNLFREEIEKKYYLLESR
ncbi:MAG: hypothetical protein JXR58_13010 [Bacteroidales bacterium]|nr:hypothetical protein [Bacteroidales bacterium]